MVKLLDFVFGFIDRSVSLITSIFGKSPSLFTSFYDVKTRSKVVRPVLYKIIFQQPDGDSVFAVEGKTWDGRRLVRFVTEEDFHTLYADIEDKTEKEKNKDVENTRDIRSV